MSIPVFDTSLLLSARTIACPNQPLLFLAFRVGHFESAFDFILRYYPVYQLFFLLFPSVEYYMGQVGCNPVLPACRKNAAIGL